MITPHSWLRATGRTFPDQGQKPRYKVAGLDLWGPARSAKIDDPRPCPGAQNRRFLMGAPPVKLLLIQLRRGIGYKISLTKVLCRNRRLRWTQKQITLTGSLTSIPFKLCWEAPLISSIYHWVFLFFFSVKICSPRPNLSGDGFRLMSNSSNLPAVYDSCRHGPCPRTDIDDEIRFPIISSSCSTTITVFPRSRKPLSID